jgi:hypothetical protein
MIVPLLAGGIGNQMFQISNAYAYSLKYNLNFAINYELSFCPNQGFNAKKYKNSIYKKINSTEVKPLNIFKEPFFHFNSIPFIGDNVLFDGYFQTEKYFKDFTKEVRNLFVFPEEVIKKVNDFIDSIKKPLVGLHIRRGDYIKFKAVHPIKGSNYYLESSKIIGNKFQAVVCTDDWKSVNNEMSFSKAMKSPFNDELEDLYLLSKCNALVLCNSSFSWWSSFLIQDKDIVIAPKEWFIGNGPKDYQDIFREGWILL